MAKEELTPEDLDALESGSGGGEYSPEDLDALESLAPQARYSPSLVARAPLLSNVVMPLLQSRPVQYVSEKQDRYLGAPTRSALSAGLKGGNPIEAFRLQFGADPTGAPTGEEISRQAGVSERVAPYTGLGVDILASPETLIPGAALGRVARAGKAATKLGAAKVLPRTAEALTGVPAKEIETFAKEYDRVTDLIKRFPDKESIPAAADAIRQGYQSKIQAFRRGANAELQASLAGEAGAKAVDAKPVITALEDAKGRINPKLYPEQIKEMDDVIAKVSSLTDGGSTTAAQMHELKQFLDDIAKPQYTDRGQRIFTRGEAVERAAEKAAREARKSFNAAVPEGKAANQKLAALRKIEDKINKNLIAPEKSDAALRGAGSGTNPRALSQLKRLEAVTGHGFVGDAEVLAAANRFQSPPLLPLSGGSTSTSRSLMGPALGFALGGKPGAVVGGALTSPFALKTGIGAYRKGVEPLMNLIPPAESLVRPLQVTRGLTVEERKRRMKALESK